MKLAITMSPSLSEAVVRVHSNFLDRLLGRVERTYWAVREPAAIGYAIWIDDSRGVRITDYRVLRALDRAYWEVDREQRKAVRGGV